jgi:hypothetical protein
VIIEKINLAESNLANKIFVAFSFMSCVDRRTVFTVLSLRGTFLQLFIKAGAGPWEQGCLEALLQQPVPQLSYIWTQQDPPLFIYPKILPL